MGLGGAGGVKNFIIPTLFLKSEGDIVIAFVCPSVCQSAGMSVMLSPPKPLDEIQPNSECELLTSMRRATANLFWPHSLGPKGGVKR